MKTPLVHVVVALGMVSASLGADKSALSLYAGQYKGRMTLSGQVTGPATGSVKASQTKKNGKINLRSRLAANGSVVQVTEKFSIRGKRFKYQFVGTGDGFVQQGTGSGRVKIFQRSIKMKGNADIGGEPYALLSTATRDRKNGNLEFDTSLTGNGGAVLLYRLKRK